jgi:hypothetical protein
MSETGKTPPEFDAEAPPEAVLDDHDEAPVSLGRSFRRKSMLKKESSRKDHLEQLVKNKRASVRYLGNMVDGATDSGPSSAAASKQSVQLTPEQRDLVIEESKFIKEVSDMAKDLNMHFPKTYSSIEVKVQDFSYKVAIDVEDTKIRTVLNQSPIHDVWHWMKRVYSCQMKKEKVEKVLLEGINLVFKPGCMYLILGDPETGGKEILLKAIAGRLHGSSNSTFEGSIKYNGLTLHVRIVPPAGVSNFMLNVDLTPCFRRKKTSSSTTTSLTSTRSMFMLRA